MQVAGVFLDNAASLKAQVDMALTINANRQESFRKSLHINGSKVKAAEFIGNVKMVLFEVGDVNIILGSPAARRRYLDIMITQTDRGYLKTLQRYQKVVFNRNRLLRGIKEKRTRMNELEYWDQRLVFEGHQVVAKRLEMLVALQSNVEQIHAELSAGEQLKLSYDSELSYAYTESNNSKMVQAALEAGLKQKRREELVRGYSVVGPHRDDVRICVDDIPAKEMSRGEARLVTLSLKMGEAEQVAAQSGKKPLVALDDAFSELDMVRRKRLFAMLNQFEQILLTSAEVEHTPNTYATASAPFWVENGKITKPTGDASPSD